MTDLELREELILQATSEMLLASSGGICAEVHFEIAKELMAIENKVAGRSER